MAMERGVVERFGLRTRLLAVRCEDETYARFRWGDTNQPLEGDRIRWKTRGEAIIAYHNDRPVQLLECRFGLSAAHALDGVV